MPQLIYKTLWTLKNEGWHRFVHKTRHYLHKKAVRLRERFLKIFPEDRKGFPPPECMPNHDVFFFSSINWQFRFQRPQQLATRFAATDHRVFFISLELFKHYCFTRRVLGRNLLEIFLPFSENNVLYDTDIRNGLDEAMAGIVALYKDLKVKEAVVVIQYPYWWPLVKRMKEELGVKVIYDCMDEHGGFSNSRPGVEELEKDMILHADICCATSRKLLEKLRKTRPDAVMIKNAADFAHFNAAASSGPPERTSSPNIGYYGAIAEWFDEDTMEYMAEKRPDWKFTLIGHTFGSDVVKLRKMKNVRFAGERSYEKLPEHLKEFDVCIIPFKVNDLILSTDPVKFYEYLAAGKPVVATRLPELEQYEGLVRLASTKEEFLAGIEAALAEDSEQLRARRVQVARANSWERRIEEIEALVKTAFAKTSIIVVTYNNLDFTKQCIESIYAKTAWPDYEVIVVDNASKDGTPDWLREQEKSRPGMKVILNPDNKGFAAANNQGIKISTGEYVILLNNDTVVTRGWIEGLIAPLAKDPSLGMIGPVTNWVGNEARIEVAYEDLARMDTFAEKYTRVNRGKRFEIKMLAMFCVAIPRRVIDKIGLLDEQFGVGMFEDDDYAMRVKQAGLKVVCVEDVFIHHKGMASFNKLQSDAYKKLFEENKAKYERKWGAWTAHKDR